MNNDIRAVILDVDGVLRDYSELMNESLAVGFKKCGLEYNFKRKNVWNIRGIEKYNSRASVIKFLVCLDKARVNLNGIIRKEDARQIIDDICKNYGATVADSLINDISKNYEVYFRANIHKMKTITGSKRAISLLLEKGYKIGLFTTSDKESLYESLRDIGVDKFDIIITKEDVGKGKPDPEGMHKIANKLKIKPRNILFIGDTEVDVLTARNSGTLSGVVLSGMGTRAHLSSLRPDFMFKNLLEAGKTLGAVNEHS
jgi:HAD superfamily hydrolase (TIGR01549 family)